jgi:predicted amidohydrolase
MSTFRVALANLPYPATAEESVALAERAIAQAAVERAQIVCFPECFVPGYRAPGKPVPPHDPAFLERAWAAVASAARRAQVAVVLGTERRVGEALRITALVLGPDGAVMGWQDKVQLDPPEEALFSPGADRQLFRVGPLAFGVVICHEGWRYPETVRWAARSGAHVVFHPHFGEAEPGAYRPSRFAEPANTFHEKAVLCRAAENTCYFASVNCAGEGSPTTSAVARPDGTLLASQPYGEAGLLVVDLDLDTATGFLARRCRTALPPPVA